MEYSYRLVIDSVIRNVRVVGCVTQFQRKFVELYTFLNTTLFITDTLKQTLVYNRHVHSGNYINNLIVSYFYSKVHTFHTLPYSPVRYSQTAE